MTNETIEKTMTSERYEELAEVLQAAIDSQVDYATEHEDAGGNYSHMIREGGWSYSNGPDRLKEWLEENGLPSDKDFIESIEDDLLDWCEMEPGHIYGNGTTKDKFIIDSYTVGEIEMQFCLPDLANILDIEEDEAKEFSAKAQDKNDFCLRPENDGGFLAYENTDSTWQFFIDVEWIKTRIAE
tara:strand:- start:831 stop:1382 length:552 start_codon:yes stop_codon:yes gene_type:complete